MTTKPQLKHTRFAKEGLDFATLFQAKFLHDDVNRHKLLMREPPADSTGGGKQAVQHIVLDPGTPGSLVVTIGQANVVTKSARLRTYDCIEQLHALRFADRPFVISQAAYQPVFDKLLEFLRKQGMQVEIDIRPPEMPLGPVAHRAASAGSAVVWVVVLVSLALGATLGYLLYSGRL
jgi:hypothetical protein